MSSFSLFLAAHTMRYVIDGYNLAHALGLIRGKVANGSLELIRKSLLQHVARLPNADPGTMTVVFDAQRASATEPDRRVLHGFTVLFSGPELADDVIEDLIREEHQPGQLTVVSDDHRLKDAARHGGCIPCACLDFVEEMMNAKQIPTAPIECSDKPESISKEETEAWLRRFSLDDDDR